ncbi:D-alanyl-D-alanine carboxypeptidase family protein [Tardiphaga sp.]|uniref:D-alanyl-D-alanine carboxypeptidase family protein n=1 Tax=Tardiphaga sp. TaxID=1926292 RepID=UPI00262C63C2|nr:D-alanyl-D-alanine carboxypeptidase family protein [Tardiphaga sp.]MDB5617232.1 Serine-type D-Ala-D-Ala carboxypeptidase [Tardiphaga sp.]
MQFPPASLRLLSLKWIVLVAWLAVATIAPRAAQAEALLVVEVESGKVLQAENATYPWYPASVTKLMTAYVVLKAVKEGRTTLDKLITVSPTAASQSPSKMGFKAGTQLTVENAMTMMMVKSANDMAVVLAESIGGSVDGFSDIMNANAARLGMTQTHYVNPNGLPADGHVTSARDLAILARAIIHDLPEYEYFVHIPSMKFGRRVTQNFNKLIGRFPGADGMKTGFICASGYNLVGTATRNGKRLIAVVLGSTSGSARAIKAAQLLERGFANNNLTWLRPALGTVDNLAPIDAAPPNLRDEMCGPKRKRPASDADEDSVAEAGSDNVMTFFTAGLQPPALRPLDMIAAAPAPSQPVIVYIGPKKTGADLIAADAVEEAKQTPKPKASRKRTVAAKPDATDSKGAKPALKRVVIQPDAATKPATAKPVAAAKPAAASKPAAAKPAAATPAKPKAAAKPAPKATTGEAKPAVTTPRT